jgi:GNAT superfamily N-acetyltransferase
MISIERREAGDAELASLLDAAFAELVVRYGADGRSQVRDGATFVVAVVGGQAVGCGALQPTGEPGVGELKRMFVVPQFRGRGIASAVLLSLEALALEQGYGVLRLATGQRQPEAVSLYEKRGYSRIEPYGKYVNDPWSRCYLKPLA